MMKIIKKVSFLTTIFLLVFTLTVPTMNFSLYENYAPNNTEVEIGASVFDLESNHFVLFSEGVPVIEYDWPEVIIWADPPEESYVEFIFRTLPDGSIDFVDFYDLPLAPDDELTETVVWGHPIDDYDDFGTQMIYGELSAAFYSLDLVYEEEWEEWEETIIWGHIEEGHVDLYDFELVYEEEIPLESRFIDGRAINRPTVTLSRGAITSNSVTVTGTITNNGGAPIIERGFWIRRSNQNQERRIPINTTLNTFSTTIHSLQPNSTYIVRAVAANSGISGHGQSAPNTFNTPSNVTVPGPPRNMSVALGDGTVRLNWQAPASNGGAQITRYEVSSNGGSSWVQAQSSTQHVFTGLPTGASRSFRVRAVNSAGAGTQAMATATPVALPALTISRGAVTSNSVSVTGTITSNGGAPIIERAFWIRRIDQGQERRVPVSSSLNSFSTVITGLTPNSTYIVRSVARNNALTGHGQSAQNTFTTPTAISTPSAPQSFRAYLGNGTVRLNWAAPSNNGGSQITRYEVSSNSGSTWTQAQSNTQHIFTGLQTGVPLGFRVRAVNQAGVGTSASLTATPVVLPTVTGQLGAVTSNSVVLNGTITNTGGAPIAARGFWIRRIDQGQEREYLVTSTSNTFSRTIGNLTPGSTYIVRAIARNTSLPSATGQSAQMTFTTAPPGTPVGQPTAPRELRAVLGDRQIRIEWTNPQDTGGSQISHFEVSRDNGFTWTRANTNSAHLFTGLVNGNTYNFAVRAVNQAGLSGAPASISASPVGLPSLTIERTALTHNSVSLIGRITDTGGRPIAARGFWVRGINDPVESEFLVSSTSNTFSQTIGDLRPNHTYIARAIARNTVLPGTGQSSEIIFTTPSPPIDLPSAPRNLRTTVGDRQVRLDWDAPLNTGGSNIVRYEVSNDNWSTWRTVGAQTRSYTFTNLINGREYIFAVRAVNARGYGSAEGIRATPQSPFHSIRYHRRTGEFGTPPQSQHNVLAGSQVTLANTGGSLGRQGYTFAGWTTSYTGTGGIPYGPGQSIEMPNRDLDLWARWTPNRTHFTITYDNLHTVGVTGRLPGPQSIPRGTNPTLADNRLFLQRPGFILAGWSTRDRLLSNDPEFTLGQRNAPLNIQEDITLYAHWVPQGNWTGRHSVSVQLFACDRFDSAVFPSTGSYHSSLRSMSQIASVPFDRTFGIDMNILGSVIPLRTAKYHCDHVSSPNFVCESCTIPAPPGFPWIAQFTGRCSSGELMLHNIPSSAAGLRTMFFAGLACSYRYGGTQPVLGLACGFGGDRSINSSSSDWTGRTGLNNTNLTIRVLQHEWSHNYGARDRGGRYGNPCAVHCIMDEGSWFSVPQYIDNLWCERCRRDIIPNRANH